MSKTQFLMEEVFHTEDQTAQRERLKELMDTYVKNRLMAMDGHASPKT